MYPFYMDFAVTSGTHSTRARGPSPTNKVLGFTQVLVVRLSVLPVLFYLISRRMELGELFLHHIISPERDLGATAHAA